MPKNDQNNSLIPLGRDKIILISVVILCLAVLFLFGSYASRLFHNLQDNLGSRQPTIKNFAECAAAGNPVMESYPEQCRTADGRVFVRQLSEEEKRNLVPPAETCQNLCGDGVCQEVVCTAIGCPCSESVASCPADCQADASPRSSNPQQQPGDTGLANPASANCQKLGGRVEIRTDLSGGQTGYCIFPSGLECEEWALWRHECAIK